MKLDRIDWNKVFFTMNYEKRSFVRLLVSFNRIWVLHISVSWYCTVFNLPTIYAPRGSAMQWSATALGGAMATIIMIAATLAEFSYIPTTWNNASHLTRRLHFLCITLGLTAGPTFYVAFFDDSKSSSQVPLAIAIVQFFISCVATILFGIMPSGQMFGDSWVSKARKYLASRTFTASYLSLDRNVRIASVFLWVPMFTMFVGSHLFLTFSFEGSTRVNVCTKVQGCEDQFFGIGSCSNQPVFMLFVMSILLFFLDAFLWYI
jgi:1,3-beta-glucan synthase